jgi:hypothetical protein
MSISDKFYQQLHKGWSKLNEQSVASEATKIHRFRGANSGCITQHGQIIGSNPREAVLRWMGIQTPTTMDDDLLFQAGHFNEDGLAAWMGAAGLDFLQEEDCPVSWSIDARDTDLGELAGLAAGRKHRLEFERIIGDNNRGVASSIHDPNTIRITGRPDFVVLDKSAADGGTPIYGIELKGIFSVGTAMEVAHFAGGIPKAINICQAAHYSWRNDKIPWLLQYVNRGWHNVFMYGPNKFTMPHRAVKRDAKTDKPVVMSPFTTIYELTWDEDMLLVDEEPTIITASGIERYFRYLQYCIITKTVPKEHDSIDIFGNAKKKDNSKKYYNFADADHSNWDAWVSDCKQIVEDI